MGPLYSLNHLVNLLVPAVFVALLTALAAGKLLPENASAVTFWGRFAAGSLVGTVVLAAGLWLFNRDGKMLTYAILVMAVATTQWIMGRGWKA